MDAEAINAMASVMVERGLMTREAADASVTAELAAMNGDVPPESIAPAVAPENATPAESKAAEAPRIDSPDYSPPDPFKDLVIGDSVFDRPARFDDYRFTMDHTQPLDNIEQREAGAMFFTARIPQVLAQTIFTTAEKTAGKPISDAEIKTMEAQTMADLRGTWGDRTDEMFGHGRRLYAELEKHHPKLASYIGEFNPAAGNHPTIVRLVCEHAERLFSSNRSK